MYRCFFIFALSFNIIGVVFTLSHHWPTGRTRAATFALTNLIVALLARNEMFLRGLYAVLLVLFKRWPPLFFRQAIATFLLHLGGFHSGFAVSGTLWLLTATIEFARSGPKLIHPAIIAFAVLATVTLLAVICSAWPSLRQHHHNS